MSQIVATHRLRQVAIQTTIHARKAVVARKKGKRRNRKAANGIRQARRAAKVAIQVNRAAVIRRVAANRHRHQVQYSVRFVYFVNKSHTDSRIMFTTCENVFRLLKATCC